MSVNNVRQYVGARYVPKFATPNEWQNNTSYEALTIVLYNNASYTSKKPVPPTIGNPADNSEYWALTGNYNAQVEQYRTDTENNINTLTNMQNEIQKNFNETSTNLNNKVEEYSTNLNNKVEGYNNEKNKVNNKKIIFIGDSYEQVAHWAEQTAIKMNMQSGTYWILAMGGQGFAAGDNGFLTLLKSFDASVDKNSITNIVVCGGANDAAYENPPKTGQGIINFCAYCRDNFPNAIVQIGFIGNCRGDSKYLENRTINNLRFAMYAYSLCGSALNATFLNGTQFLLHRGTFDIGEDGLHPTTEWGNYAGNMIANAILSGGCSPSFIANSMKLKAENDGEITGAITAFFNYNICTFNIQEIVIKENIENFGIDWVPIFTYDGKYFNSPFVIKPSMFVSTSDSAVVAFDGILKFDGATCYCRSQSLTSTIDITQIVIRDYEFVVDSFSLV